jgi:heme o synthase
VSLTQVSILTSKVKDQVPTATWRDFFQLTKPTISLLVVVTVIPGLLMGSVAGIPPLKLIAATLFGTWLASASAAVFNHLVDSDIDQTMTRTRKRPVASGRVEPSQAFLFGTGLGILSFLILWIVANPLTAWISLAANAFYVLFYTAYLKRRTVQNIVIGGAAGAVGPLMGWAAVAGDVAWPAWVLFAIIFMWTPPHFWALAIKYKEDYASAGVPMMPSVRGVRVTKWQMFLYTLSLWPLVASLFIAGVAGWVYFAPSAALTIYFSWLSLKLLRSADDSSAMPLFHFSCLYLFGVFGSLMFDRLF